MAENFDIAKFLKENALGSYGILGHYVDLQPLKEMNEDLDDVDDRAQASAQDWFDEYEEEGRLDDFYGMSVEELIDALKLFGEDDAQEVAPILHKMINQEDGNMNETEDLGGWDDDEFIVEKKGESKDKKVDVYNADEIIYMGEEPLMVDKKTTIKKGDALDSDKLVDDDTKYRRAILSVDGPQFKYKNQMYILYDIDPEDDRYGFDDDDDYESGGRSIHLTKSLDEKKEDLGGWDGNKKYSQYNGKYDDEFGPAIANENVEMEEGMNKEFNYERYIGNNPLLQENDKKGGNAAQVYHNILAFMRDEIKRSKLSSDEVPKLRKMLADFFK